ncbi:MAG: GFA family protein [Kiloniellaceae bacterium]
MNETESAARESHAGGCLCGRIRYRVTGPIESVVHCHCGMCRRATGAAVVTWITVPVARFAITKGEPATYRSSDHGRRSYCPSCGAQIAFNSTHAPDDVDVTLGTLDHPEDHPADRHVWTSSRLPWLELDPDLPAHAAFTPGDAGS